MKQLIKLLIILFCIISFNVYSQDTLKINPELWNLTKIEYKYENYSNPDKIEFYNKRIADVLIKYEYILCNKDEYENAVKTNWFEIHFKPALNKAIEDKNIFTQNNNLK